jgi:hypothetical protein
MRRARVRLLGTARLQPLAARVARLRRQVGQVSSTSAGPYVEAGCADNVHVRCLRGPGRSSAFGLPGELVGDFKNAGH